MLRVTYVAIADNACTVLKQFEYSDVLFVQSSLKKYGIVCWHCSKH